MNRLQRIIVALSVCAVLSVLSLVGLRLLGLLIPFGIPTAAMAPALSPGDKVLMEGFTLIKRKPERGDIVVFRAEGMEFLHPDETYVKRVAGKPGDNLRIADGKLFVNGNELPLQNKAGPIRYVNMIGSTFLADGNQTVTVPEGSYFLLGDNSTNSLDSRYFGFVPGARIRGRIWFYYSPVRSFGAVK